MMLPGADPSGRSPGCEQPRVGDEEPAEGHNLRVSHGCSHCIRLMANGGHVSPGGGGTAARDRALSSAPFASLLP